MIYIFAGDRDISVWVLEILINSGFMPSALLISEDGTATHASQLIQMSGLQREFIFKGKEFEQPESTQFIKDLMPDFIIGIHFPYIIKRAILEIPKKGCINLHPSFLPFNRGWHTPSWAILEKTPIGATLHFMSEGLDSGDVIHQRRLEIEPQDTANSLYQKLKELELKVFIEALPSLISSTFQRTPLNISNGTIHKREELFDGEIQRIDLDRSYKASDFIDKLRALTTSIWNESAYFEKNGKKYYLRIEIIKDEISEINQTKN
jgi:methionyl-tRNA formyltransferase